VSTQKSGSFWGGLGGHVEDAAALGAMDNSFGCSDLDDGLGGDFHVAAHADFMFEGGDGETVFGFEEMEVDVEDAFVEKLSESLVFAFEFGDPAFQVGFLALQPCEQLFDLAAFLGMGFFRGHDLRVEDLEFLHEIEFSVFERGDRLFGSFDFVGKGGIFLVSSRLELLLLVAGDGIAFGTCFDFQISPFDLDLFGTAFCLLESSGGVGELLFACLTLFGQVGDFNLEAAKALVSILQGEQLLDDIKHR
jgi:hypothetical protein